MRLVLERVGTITCPKCKGTGRRWKRRCRYCEGYGQVDVLGCVPHDEEPS